MMCAVEGCPRRARSRGWCNTHYSRWWNHGSPLTVTIAVGMCRLDAAPLVAAVDAYDRPLAHTLTDRERRAFYRARRQGWVNDQHAERILDAIGRTLADTYGPAWDEVAA